MQPVKILLPLPPKELRSNYAPYSRTGQIIRSKKIREYRIQCKYLSMAQAAKMIRKVRSMEAFPKIEIKIVTTYVLKDRRSKQDDDNLVHWAKTAYDGFSDAIGINDRHFKHELEETDYNKVQQSVTLEISVIESS